MLKNTNNKLKYLNIGCGNNFHKDWINIDMVSFSPHIIQYNILKKIPLPDNFVKVVYHSQVLEHIPKKKALPFIKECYRVLELGGIIRIVVPDLENIINEFKRLLKENLLQPTELSKANYEWITIELFDQMVRNNTGGLMREYLSREKLINKDYVLKRSSFIGEKIYSNSKITNSEIIKDQIEKYGYIITIKKIIHLLSGKFKGKILGKKYQIGNFRLSGEVHMWMYDRFSLCDLLKECGFKDVTLKTPYDSDIPSWSDFQLDVKNGKPYNPTSLFIEAKK